MIKKDFDNNKVDLALMAKDIKYIQADVVDIKSKMEANYATKEWVNAEYGQTKMIVSAILATLGLAVVGAFATFIIRGGLK